MLSSILVCTSTLLQYCRQKILPNSDINPNSHGPFFPFHLIASGHSEPGSSGHLETWPWEGVPLLPPSQQGCHRALNTVYMDTLNFNIVYVGNYFCEYIYFFYKLKETYKFWANGCHVKDPLPLLSEYKSYYKELLGPGLN